VKHYECNLD